MKFLASLLLLISLPAFAQTIKTISWDEARISDKITLTLPKQEFDKRFKKADSITAPRVGETCGTEEEAKVQMVHYKGVRFELDNGIMNFRSIDFSKRRGLYFSTKDDWFDHTTTLKSFSKAYPEAAEYSEDYETEEGETMVMLTLLPDTVAEKNEWRFFFKDGKLHSIECYFPCD